MTFLYEESALWLDDIVEAPQPYGYPLCGDHSDRLTPPHGWTLTDRRKVTRLFAPVNVA